MTYSKVLSSFFLFILVCISLVSCIAYHYVPSTPYVPLNTQKGELKLNLSYNCYQIGYSLSDRFSVFSTGFHRVNTYHSILEKEGSGSDSGGDEFYDYSIGGSYFKSINSITYELLGGIGYGSNYFHHHKDLYYYDFEINSNKTSYYIQPDIGVKFNEYSEMSLFSRFIGCHYYNMRTNGDFRNGKSIDPSDSYFVGRKSLDLYFIEPGLMCRAGFKHFKLEFSGMTAFSLNNSMIVYQSIHLNVSAYLNLNLFKEKK